jgi:hypothetical protein
MPTALRGGRAHRMALCGKPSLFREEEARARAGAFRKACPKAAYMSEVDS